MFFERPIDQGIHWIAPPPGKERATLLYYLKQKDKDANNIGAAFVLPKSKPGQDWLPLLRGMKLVKQISKSDRILYNASTMELTNMRRDIHIYYDAVGSEPLHKESKIAMCVAKDVELPDMMFNGYCQDIPTNILLDTGAGANFIDEATAKKIKAHVTPTQIPGVQGAGANVLQILGKTTAPIQLGSYKAPVDFYIVPRILPGVELVLGKRWQKLNRVIINCGKWAKIRPEVGQNYKVYPAVSQEAYKSNDVHRPADTMEMSENKARKAIRRGAPYYMLLIRQIASSPDAGATAQGPAPQTKVANTGQMVGVPPQTDHLDERSTVRAVNTKCIGKTPGTEADVREGDAWTDHSPRIPADSMPATMTLLDDAFLEKLHNDYKSSVLSPDLPSDPEAYRPPDNHQHVIRTEINARIPKRQYRRLSPSEYALCKEYVEDLLRKGFIAPSTSPYGAPIMLVPKPAGGFRVVCDWRALNAITIKNRFPLPRIDEALDQLGGAQIFSSLDLNSGYFQIRINEEDAHKTAFTTPFGLYEFKVLGQGLANAPATFQAIMNKIFAPYINKFVIIYLDDILIYSKTPEEHERHLRIVLDLLKENKFYAKPNKCVFGVQSTKFLGHIVGCGGVRPDPAKINTVTEWPAPSSTPALRSFLGLTNYFRKFVKHYATIAAPLIRLTGNIPDIRPLWGKEQQQAFEALKVALTTAPVLAHPDFSKPFELVSDASLQGTGAVLMQEERVISYTSKAFNKAERNYTTTEQEMLGVIRALTEWRHYFDGDPNHLTIITDHNPLTYFDSKTTLSRRLERWVEFMGGFSYVWKYRKGANNVADALSRQPLRIPEEVNHAILSMVLCPANLQQRRVTRRQQLKTTESPVLQQIKEAYRRHPDFGADHGQGLVLNDGIYWKKGRIALPPDKDVITFVIKQTHDQPLYGHPGIQRTLEHLRRAFYWPTMETDVTTYVKSCYKCQTNKHPRTKPAGKLQPLEIPQAIWEHVSMDLITDLPVTDKGNDCILVMVDKLSKMVHMAPCKKTVNGKECADLFRDNVIKLHGIPRKLITDRDTRFRGKFMDALTTALGITQALSTSFHPQTDGQTENMNKLVEDVMRNYVSAIQTDWDTWLPQAEFAINNAYNASIKTTPFRLVYGRDPLTPFTVQLPHNVEHAKLYLQDNILRAERARYFMKAAAERQKSYADQKRRDIVLKVDDKVLLSTKNLSIKADGTRKFYPRFVGPFRVTHVYGNRALAPDFTPTAAKLDLPRNCKIHPVFHISLLRPFFSREGDEIQPPELELDQEGYPIFEVEGILGERQKKLRSSTVTEYLLRWKGYDHLHDTWEEERMMNCPELLAEWRRTHPRVQNLQATQSRNNPRKRPRTMKNSEDSRQEIVPAPQPAEPPSDPRTAIRHLLPTTALRGRTKQETERLQRLQNSTKPIPPITIEEIKARVPKLRPLAAVHPTLAALIFIQDYL